MGGHHHNNEKIEVNQVWRQRDTGEPDTRFDRLVRIFNVTTLDVKVRSCLLSGVLCARTPLVKMPIKTLRQRFDLVAVLSIFQIDEAAQDDGETPRMTSSTRTKLLSRYSKEKK
jgi:hypothetical protein